MKIIKAIKKFAKEDRMALICEKCKMSYKELDDISEGLAAYIIEEYKGDNAPIIIYGDKENLISACMIAALKSGRAYIPIDISYPKERVNKIIEEVNAKVIFNFSEENDFKSIKVIYKSDIDNIVSRYENISVNKSYWVNGDENAYILFTSGSTGTPKGVQISSNNLDNFLMWITGYLNIDDSKEKIINQVSYSFDVSVLSIYLGLCNGKTLCSFSKNTISNLKIFFENLSKSNLNMITSTPAFLQLCITDMDFNQNMMPGLKYIFMLGEVLPKSLCEELMKRFPKTRIINGYGPTEATVAVCAIDINREMLTNEETLPIGYPIKEDDIYIYNDGKKVADGIKGEIIIKGKSVSKGYFNNKQLTDKSFFIIDNERAYKTGDIGFKKNGKFYYCGREDFQIKINGYRIELEDIEANILKIRDINNAIVIPKEEASIQYLVAFIQTDNEKIKVSDIKKKLAELVPKYMIPRKIKLVNELPTNVSGKIDRKRLEELI